MTKKMSNLQHAEPTQEEHQLKDKHGKKSNVVEKLKNLEGELAAEKKNNQELKEQLAAEKKNNKELYDRYLRMHAEFENYKKRREREKEDFIKYAIEKSLKDLLPIIDHLEMAIKSSKECEDFNSLSQGIDLIHKQLNDFLAKEGVSLVSALGEKFDPTVHEAIMQKGSTEHEDNTIIEEHQKGYILKDRLLRPARVTVAKRKNK
ncbi:MAG: nucleotide exchange factor GrpE [bacterium]